MEGKCQLCGKGFEAKRRDAKYCSKCQTIKHREYGRKCDAKRKWQGKCSDCGKPISRKSGRCRVCSRKGELNNFWKGGRWKSISGYIYVYSPNHPRVNSRYVAEHRLVWEKAHGQLLPDGWLVHHLNGIKDDNRPENLVALQPNGHSTRTFVQILQEHIRKLEEV